MTRAAIADATRRRGQEGPRTTIAPAAERDGGGDHEVRGDGPQRPARTCERVEEPSVGLGGQGRGNDETKHDNGRDQPARH